ncbi:MAG: ubiquinol-cytochrome C chaperone family protein [Pseudolabrys sp.]
MIWPLIRRHPRSDTISTLYGMIVAQARMPCFYRDYGVADTLNGRFDLIVLHLTLFLHRLGNEAPAHKAIGQAVFDHFCRDMDDNLREMGVGDLTVPRKMRRIGAAYYQGSQAYEAALAAGGVPPLTDAIAATVEAAPTQGRVAAARLAAYMIEALRELRGQSCEGFERGELRFPDPENVSE